MKVYLILECSYNEGCDIYDIYVNEKTRDEEFERLKASGSYGENSALDIESQDWVLNTK